MKVLEYFSICYFWLNSSLRETSLAHRSSFYLSNSTDMIKKNIHISGVNQDTLHMQQLQDISGRQYRWDEREEGRGLPLM